MKLPLRMQTLITDELEHVWSIMLLNRRKRPRVVATNLNTGIVLTELDSYIELSNLWPLEEWPAFIEIEKAPHYPQEDRLF
jgi:hypothetical protein